jgi:RHS repeat-associated protein
LLSDGTWNYSYDADGNLIGKVGVSGGINAGLTWTYSYDPGNEMISATEINASQTLVQDTFTYDVFGHLAASSVSLNGGAAVDSDFVYNGDELWAQLTGPSQSPTVYISGDQPDQYFAQVNASDGVSGLLADHLGSIRVVTDAAGQPMQTDDYNAYGKLVSLATPSQDASIGYAGSIYEITTGLNREDHRWYNPLTGQWTTQDPLGLQPGPNPYEYVNDAPTNATDPTGEWILAQNRMAATQTVAELKKWHIEAEIFPLVGAQRYYVYVPRTPAQRDELAKRHTDNPHWDSSFQKAAWGSSWNLVTYAGNEKDGLRSISWSRDTVHKHPEARGEGWALSPDDRSLIRYYNSGGRTIPQAAKPRVYTEMDPGFRPSDNPWYRDSDRFLDFIASNKFQQGLRVAGGAASVISGIVLLTTPGGQVFGMLLIGSGLDDLQASARSLAGGKHVDSLRHDVAAGLAARAGVGKTGQQVVGVVADIGVPTAAAAGPSAVRLAGKVSRLGRASKIALGAEGTVVENAGGEANTLGKLLHAENAEVSTIAVEGITDAEVEAAINSVPTHYAQNAPKKPIQGEFDFETGGVKFPTTVEVPSVRGGTFQRWFNNLTPEELWELWKNPKVRETIEARLRSPGGFHEWLPVSRAPKFKEWGITAEQIQELRTATSKVKFQPSGGHGEDFSGTFHNMIFEIADKAPNFAAFKEGLAKLADKWLEGGAAALPPGLRP